MKDIIRMNELAGTITESQAKRMMDILNENPDTAPSDALDTVIKNRNIEKVRNKHTKLTFDVKRVRDNGKIELMNGVVIPETEFKLNWEVVA
jgi:hypothetical protein